ncbi:MULTISPECIES: hypothetical protein [unclassified Flavobacterium]|uniref:hypothetical protein n=1 Tax=unclassified Flavobacterium TaxID=196869 RepID=UPI0023532ED8|nr:MULTISPECIES: hypothetical protein [unclassified Flavobacterium]
MTKYTALKMTGSIDKQLKNRQSKSVRGISLLLNNCSDCPAFMVYKKAHYM